VASAEVVGGTPWKQSWGSPPSSMAVRVGRESRRARTDARPGVGLWLVWAKTSCALAVPGSGMGVVRVTHSDGWLPFGVARTRNGLYATYVVGNVLSTLEGFTGSWLSYRTVPNVLQVSRLDCGGVHVTTSVGSGPYCRYVEL
jgi:hypothetical protein